jgi:hypothetical protein
MLTAAAEPRVDITVWAATDPVDSIHPYNIPILPFKHPPAKEDFHKSRRQRKENKPEPPETTHSGGGEGHVDDYA